MARLPHPRTAAERRRWRDVIAAAVGAVTAGGLAGAIGLAVMKFRRRPSDDEPADAEVVELPAAPARKRWRDFLFGWIAAYVVAGAFAGAVGIAILQFGAFDTTASMPHMAPIGWSAHQAFIAHTKHSAGRMSQVTITPGEVVAGFRQYEQDCVQCHGGPGVPRGDLASGLNPPPPYLLDAPRRWTPAQLYWILAQGVKMTAMPSWRATRTNVQVWDLVAFVEALPYLSPQDYANLRASQHTTPREVVAPAGQTKPPLRVTSE